MWAIVRWVNYYDISTMENLIQTPELRPAG
jgi:hypothetical protein